MGIYRPIKPAPESKIFCTTRRQYDAMVARATSLEMSQTAYCRWVILTDCHLFGHIADVLAPDSHDRKPKRKRKKTRNVK